MLRTLGDFFGPRASEVAQQQDALLQALEAAVADVKRDWARQEGHIKALTAADAAVKRLLAAIEACLGHGIRRWLRGGSPSAWPLLLRLPEFDPAAASPVRTVQQSSDVKTPGGKARAWVREMLARGQLHAGFQALVRVPADELSRYFVDHALLADQTARDRAVASLQALAGIKFALVVHDPSLDEGQGEGAPSQQADGARPSAQPPQTPERPRPGDGAQGKASPSPKSAAPRQPASPASRTAASTTTVWPSTVIVAGADATQVNGPFYRSASQQSGGAPKYVSSSGGDYEIFRFRVKAASGHAHWRWFIGCPAAKEVLYFCVEPPMAAQDGELPPHNGWRVHPAVAGRVKSAPTLRPAIDGPAESPQSSEPSPPQRAGPAASQSSRATEGKGPAAQARAAGPHQPQLRGEYVQAVGDGESTSTGSTASTASGSDEEDEEEEREGGGPDSGASEEGGEGDAVARPREPGPGSGRDGGAARTTDAQALAALARRVQHRRSLHRAPTPSKPAAHAHRSRPPSPASEAGRGASQASAEDERRGRRIEAALGRVFAEGEPRSGRPLFQAPVLEPSAVCKDGDASRCPLLPHVARALDDHGALASLQALFAVRHGKRTQVAKLGRDRCRLTCVRAHDAALGAFAARRRVLLDQLAAVGLTPATAAVAAAADASRRRRTTSSSSLASRRKDLLLSWRRLDAKSQEASSAQPSRSVNGQEGRRREGKGDGRRPPLRRGRRGRSDHRPEDWGNGSDSDIAAHAAQALARSFAPAEPARSRQGSAGSVGDSPVDEGWGNGVSEGMEGDSARSASVGGPLQQEQRRLQQQGSSGDLASLREGMQPAAERQRASSVNSGLAPPPRLVVMPTPAAATLPAAGSGGNCATAAVEAQEAGSDEAVDASGVVHFSAELAQSEQRSDTHGTDKHVVYAIDVAFPVAAPCAEWAVGLSADGGGETALAGAAGGESDGEKREASSSAANSNTPALARASAVLAEELRGWRVYRRYGRFKALHQHLLFAQREEAESGNGGFDLPPLPAAKGMKRLFRARPGDEHKEEALAEYLRSAVALQAASARARAAVALFLLPDPAVDACAVEQEAVVVARPRSAGHDPVSPTLDARPPQRQPPPGATLQDVQERAVAELGSPAFADAVEGDAAAVARLVWRLLRDQASRLLRGTHMALTLEGARSALSDRASFPRALAPARPAAPLRMDLLVHQPDNEVQGLAPDAIVALQGGKCAGCCGPIQRSSLWSSCIRCRYTGHCFCTACHKERLHPLPWRVLHRWDFTPHKVAESSHEFLRQVWSLPSVPLEEVAPDLRWRVKKVARSRKLRKAIVRLHPIGDVCRAYQAVVDSLPQSLVHLWSGVEYYSMTDLQRLESGDLIPFLTEVGNRLSRHVFYECPEGCRQRAVAAGLTVPPAR